MIHLTDVLAAAEHLQAFCRARNWPFCFIGGIAVQRWGEPRLTQDVDLTLLTGFGSEEAFVDTLLKSYSARRTDAREFALANRVLLLNAANGTGIDIALGAFPFEERAVGRASPWPWTEERLLTTCSAEDLVVHKAFAGRNRDWADLEPILTRQHGKLNLSQIRFELKPLLELKGELDGLERLDRMLNTVERRLRSKA
jgi:hypothetical protein